jgi:hypothetical protein
MRTLGTFAVVCLASSASAQAPIDATWQNGPPSSMPPVVQQQLPPNSLMTGWSDNFDRPDAGVLGGDWTQQTGSMGIATNRGVGTGTANSWAQHNLATVHATNGLSTAIARVDALAPTAPGIVYVALIFGTGGANDSVFIKVQDNSSAGNYNRMWFYRGINGGGGGGPTASFAIATPFTSARMTAYFTNGGDTAVLEVDTNFDGTAEETFQLSGYLASPPSGNGAGVGSYRNPHFDNWTFDDGGSPAAPTVYCTAGTTTNGCNASIGANSQPSATQATSCQISIAGVEGQRAGIVFYGLTSGPQRWCSLGGGSSFLCVKPPTQRTLTHNSGGTSGQCDGTLSLDWDAFQLANPGAVGAPWVAGAQAFVQGWFRDPPACKTTSTSNALELTYLP